MKYIAALLIAFVIAVPGCKTSDNNSNTDNKSTVVTTNNNEEAELEKHDTYVPWWF